MKIYLIRHGESQQTEHVHQSNETPLSDRGIIQAKALATRFAHIPVDLILSSPLTRALQTAQEIQKVTKAPLQQSELLKERNMPSSFIGKSVTDPAILPSHQQIRENFYTRDWHHEDEENFFDLQSRVRKVLEFIKAQNKETVAVVTHGYFLTVMVYDILFGQTENHHMFRQFKANTEFSNGGITIVEYVDMKWRILTMNNCMHLGG